MAKISISELKQNYPIVEVAKKLGIQTFGYEGNTLCAHCFNHEDKNPSLVFMPNVNRWECKACGKKGDVINLVEEVMKIDFKAAVEWLCPGYFSSYQEQNQNHKVENINPETYLQSRLIRPETAQHFGLRVNKDCVIIPIPTGEKYRFFYQTPKYKHKAKSKVCLFKTAENTGKTGYLCAGEFDSILAWQETELPMWSGTGGEQTFNKEWLSDFSSFEKIYIIYDTDQKGREGALNAANELGVERCLKVVLPEGIKDITEYFQAGYTKENFIKLFEQAKPFRTSIVDLLNSSEKEAGLKHFSGFSKIDGLINGFRAGNCYCVSGLEKCGKTSFCLNMLNQLLLNNVPVGYINTELTAQEFATALSAVHYRKPKEFIEIHKNLRTECMTKFAPLLQYSGIDGDELRDKQGTLSFPRIVEKIKEFVKWKTQVIFIDNLTTFNTMATAQQRGWEILASSLSMITSLAKKHNLTIFPVVHTKPNTVMSEAPNGIKAILKDRIPEKIFDETISIIRKPTIADVYGGGGVLSQLSGTILIWRPYQKFNAPYIQRMSMIILESFRHSSSGGEITMNFDGASGIFTEIKYTTQTSDETTNFGYEKNQIL
ncbi:MAG TPA: CHC2 zinc finger domain-containing protein [Patescibacteria group bacterium]|nr:CHC2 zinc finger domain-containing protein [Patescibacteria group bacterium]